LSPAVLMDAVKVCSLGQISHALYEVGGEVRRNMQVVNTAAVVA